MIHRSCFQENVSDEKKENNMKIIAINAGPRSGWNTDALTSGAKKGAESAGAVVERFDHFKLERYTGCISCFGCKKETSCCNQHPTAKFPAKGNIAGAVMYLGLVFLLKLADKSFGCNLYGIDISEDMKTLVEKRNKTAFDAS